MSNALAIYEQFDNLERAAVALQQSGYFPDARSQAQAVVKVMAGAELGIPPFASMTGIHIIKGKPELGANLMAALVQGSGRFNYRITRLDNDACDITFYEQGQVIGVSSFTAADAKAANLSGDNWSKFRRNMLFARAMSNGVRWYCPSITRGMTVYAPGEVGGDEVVESLPDVVEGEIVQPATNGAPDPGPLPDDEQVIAETPAADFINASAALLGLAAQDIKDMLHTMDVHRVPGNGRTAERLELYRRMRTTKTLAGALGVDGELFDIADLDATQDAVSRE